MVNIILCGGSGTRLWPISRTKYPKQFSKIFGESLFQKSIKRNLKACSDRFIVSNSEQYFLAVDQLEELKVNSSNFLLEPVGRNTAPAIALACLELDPKTIVLVTPSDHLVKDEESYNTALEKAKEEAEKGFLVTFGINPEFPETGFGYIEADGNDVLSFKEKPDLETAKSYLEKGNYYWNSGMFCFRVSTFSEEIEKYSPQILEKCKSALKNAKKDSMIRIKHDDMFAIPEDSIDYAVMEKSEKVKVIPCDIGWSDMGSFDSLGDEFEKDSDGNTNDKSNILIESKNNLVISEQKKLITTIGIEDLIIVDTADALLISKKGESQKVKQAVAEVKKRGLELHNIHKTAHKPWGTYTILEDKEGYKIKKIVVKPKHRLSLQKHLHRSEHWIVVTGTATVTVGDETTTVKPNESTYIPIGVKHRLENQGVIDLVLIEAQVGEYTGEDDIIRFDDDYNRE